MTISHPLTVKWVTQKSSWGSPATKPNLPKSNHRSDKELLLPWESEPSQLRDSLLSISESRNSLLTARRQPKPGLKRKKAKPIHGTHVKLFPQFFTGRTAHRQGHRTHGSQLWAVVLTRTGLSKETTALPVPETSLPSQVAKPVKAEFSETTTKH